jgi:hypothetical protein
MFDRAEIQARVNDIASLPHTVEALSPYAFELRPAGFPDSVPNYRVLVERVAFRLRAQVVPDYLAVAIVAAVVAGARNNPLQLQRLRDAVEAMGWTPQIALSAEEFHIEAVSSDAGADDEDLADAASHAAVTLSEFVLDQLIVTQPIGEMRPAVERRIGEESVSQVWLYDPSERDRATQVHRSLENWLIAKLRESGVQPLDPAGEPFFDVAWIVGRRLFVCEVKSSANSETHQLRLGLGQVIQYRHILRSRRYDSVDACLLIENEPQDARWLQICSALEVTLFWPDKWDEVERHLLLVED